MTKIFCHWCEKEIKEIKGVLEVSLTGLLSFKDPTSILSDPREYEGRLFYFCSDDCKLNWMKVRLRKPKFKEGSS